MSDDTPRPSRRVITLTRDQLIKAGAGTLPSRDVADALGVSQGTALTHMRRCGIDTGRGPRVLTHRVDVRLTADEAEVLANLATDTGATVSVLVRDALRGRTPPPLR